jgi:2,3-bisphosphoglycerate-independent phosphoglycerate mutase
MGNLQLKIETIETFDEKIVGAILRGMDDFKSYKVLVLPDHPTPLSIRTHAADPVPYVIYPVRNPHHSRRGWRENGVNSTEGKANEAPIEGFDEVSAQRSGIFIERGFELIERFLTSSCSC